MRCLALVAVLAVSVLSTGCIKVRDLRDGPDPWTPPSPPPVVNPVDQEPAPAQGVIDPALAAQVQPGWTVLQVTSLLGEGHNFVAADGREMLLYALDRPVGALAVFHLESGVVRSRETW